MAQENVSWQRGVCDCSSSCDVCLCATFTPCCLFNRIGTQFKGHDAQSCGWDCCMYFSVGCVLGLPCIPLGFRRYAIRNEYKIKAWCCSCCVLHQLDWETKHRPSAQQEGYQRPSGMAYNTRK
ncbi:PLAC8 family protein [Aspergillus fumigatus Af293]|uniref:DUF614 domain protein n=1 Tax=Aspergillus fumigatus (strain ATCC MYA-4609 / CBS 101355 / FGSC A1100 / Af293) TaxID=330879 RepID=Q4WL51_ASPFU|nr:DUF614 domain protein [Aspergillus fumigatus Af293]EAL87731.1 DUF614 domain protein [Aspergillus fumigatus Af293]